MSQRDHLRAADVDRSFVAELLKRAVDEGRLSLSEYDDRLRRTYEAVTYGDLDGIIADLPRPSRRSAVLPATSASMSAVSSASGSWSPKPVPRDRDWLRGVWAAWAVAVAVNTVIWLIITVTTGNWIYPWPLWVAGPWGAVLLVGTIFGRRGDGSGDARR